MFDKTMEIQFQFCLHDYANQFRLTYSEIYKTFFGFFHGLFPSVKRIQKSLLKTITHYLTETNAS